MHKFLTMKTMKKNFLSNKFWFWLVVITGVALLVPNLAWASGFSDDVAQFIGNVIFYVLEVELILLPIIAQFNNFTDLPGVVIGWTAMRDLANMFFIVVLLVMAFSTILKFQAYGYRQLLRNLIIMAILVNFSKFIVGFVIDFFQVIMLTFVSAFKDVAACNITVALGLDKLVSFATNQGDAGVSSTGAFGQIILGYLLASIMVVWTVIVILAFIVTLVMRIVMLWILVVLAPLAFVANTFPNTKNQFQSWMGSLTKEVIIGPLLAFFLWLSFTIVGQGVRDEFINEQTTGGTQEEISGDESLVDSSVGPTQAGQWDNILVYIVGLSMLIGSLKVASKFGSTAGSVGAAWGGKAQKMVGSAYRKLGKQAARPAVWAAKSSWQGTTGVGGIKGGLKRADAYVTGGLMRNVGSKIPVVGSVINRGGMRKQGNERKRVQDKAQIIEKGAENIRPQDQEEYWEGRVGNISKYERAKTRLAEGGPTTNEQREEDRQAFEHMADDESLAKMRQTTAVAYDEGAMIRAIKTGELATNFTSGKLDLGATVDKDEHGNAELSNDRTYRKLGNLMARGFLELSPKQQVTSVNAMTPQDQAALFVNVAAVPPEQLAEIDDEHKQKLTTTIEKKDEDGNVVERKGVANENSAVHKKSQVLNRLRFGSKEALAASKDYETAASKEVADKKDSKKQPFTNSDTAASPQPMSFDIQSMHKSLAKGLEGKDLARMSPDIDAFKEVVKHLSDAQVGAISREANTGKHMRVIVNVRAEAAQAKIEAGQAEGGDNGMAKVLEGQSELRKLSSSILTRHYYANSEHAKKHPQPDEPKKSKSKKKSKAEQEQFDRDAEENDLNDDDN